MNVHTIQLYLGQFARLALSLALGAGPALASPGRVAAAGEFASVPLGLPAVGGAAVDWGDYDGDGDLDLALAGESSGRLTRIYRNDGGGVFQDITAPLTPVSYADLAWADFDLDGDLDLAIAGSTNGVSGLTRLYRNFGNDQFADTGFAFLDVYYPAVDWGDYDNDGDPDLFVGGAMGYPNWSSRLYRNDGGTLVESGEPINGTMWSDAAWADYDDDGDLDFITTGCDTTPCTYVYRNTGGHFAQVATDLPPLERGAVAWGDYDNDGDLDIALMGYGGTSSGAIAQVYRNEGNGLFTNRAFSLTPGYQGNLAWADYDQDGWLDLLITGWCIPSCGAYAQIYHNQAGTGFSNLGAALAPLGDTHAAAWGDADNDGDADLLLGGYYYRNEAATANTRPSAPSGLAAVPSGYRVTLAWSAASDAQTPTSALTYNLRVGTQPGAGDLVPAHANSDGTRQLAELGNVQTGLTATLEGLVPNTTYYWSVQAIDGAYLGSAFAPEQSFTLPPPAVRFSQAAYTATETGGSFPVTVELDAPSGVTVTVDYASAPGSATPGEDYAPASGTLVFAPGTLTQTLGLPLLDDLADEPDETLTLALSGPVSATLGAPATATVTLRDNLLVVTHPEDVNDGQCTPADCSLREAVIAANSLPGANQILVPAGAYTLSIPGEYEAQAATGDLNIRDSVRVLGAGPAATIIDGGQLDRVFEISGVGGAVPEVTLSGLAVVNGRTSNLGGGVASGVSLLLTDTVIAGNSAEYDGGGVWSAAEGRLTIENSAILSNTAGLYGGGLASDGALSLWRTTVTGNQAAEGGGGMAVTGAATLTEVAISGNAALAGGGLFQFGASLEARAVAILSNTAEALDGGGVYLLDGGLWLTDTTVAGNTAATSGGGLYASGLLFLTNATVSDNAAGTDGGGLYNASQANLGSVTISANHAGGDGGGLATSGTLSLRNTLLGANSDGAADAPDCAGTIVSQGYNLIGDTRQCTVQGVTSSNLTGVDPRLHLLGDYGGPTLTRPPGAGSPAIDAAHPASPGTNPNSCPAADQRGQARPQDGDLDGAARCDIGAVEVAGLPAVGFQSGQAQVAEDAGALGATVALSHAAEVTVTVAYQSAPGSAEAGLDYAAVSGALVFSPGVTSQVITVPILPDALDEADEWFGLALSDPVSATLGAADVLTATIADDDGPVGLRFSAATYSAVEGGLAVLTATLSAASGLTVTAGLVLTPLTAGAGDYLPIGGTLTFAPGQTVRLIQVELLDDGVLEPVETFLAALCAPAAAVLGDPSQAVVSIGDAGAAYRLYLPSVIR